MDLSLTHEQRELQAAVRTFVSRRFPLGELAVVEHSGQVTGHWDEIGRLGVFSMGGDGLGARDAVVAFEELGRGLVPGPLVATHLAAGLVDGAADGSTVVALLEPQPQGTLVEHAVDASVLLWFDGGELRGVDPRQLTFEPVARPLDPLTPVWRTPDHAPPSWTVLAVGDEAARQHRRGIVLTAAMQVGVASAAVELATAHARERHQFGRPIGSFQAVKHLLADMFTAAEVGRAAVYAAACALDGAGTDDPERAASAAKVTAGDAALLCGKGGIQVHGGMGFTWDVAAQRYWKRAVVLDKSFGSADHHARHVADLTST